MADYIKSSLVANAKTYEIFNKKNENARIFFRKLFGKKSTFYLT